MIVTMQDLVQHDQYHIFPRKVQDGKRESVFGNQPLLRVGAKDPATYMPSSACLNFLQLSQNPS